MANAAGLDISRPYDYSRAAFIAEDTDGKLYATSGCYIFNPGGTNTYALQQVTPNADGIHYDNVDGVYKRVKVSSAQLGFDGLRRTYNNRVPPRELRQRSMVVAGMF